MLRLQSIVEGLRALLHKEKVEQEMDEELRGYLDAAVQEKMRSGMSYEQALRAARVEMGSMDAVKEEIRSVGWEATLGTFWQDIRYGLRQLRRNPGFTAAVVLTLALSIGANTAVFSLVNAVMFKLLPVRDPQQLVLLCWGDPGDSLHVTKSGYNMSDGQGRQVSASFAFPIVEQLRSQRQVFSSVFGFVPLGHTNETLNASVDGQASMADGAMVTGDYFSGLGVLPVLGRMITDTDVTQSAPRVAVISYSYWTRRFGRTPSAVGKAVFINGVAFTVVGVAPPEFFGVQPGHAPDIWIPMIQEARIGPWGAEPSLSREMWTTPGWWWVMVLARLQPGVTKQQALGAAQVPFLRSAAAVAKTPFKPNESPQVEFLPISRGLHDLRLQYSQPLLVLMAVVSLVLLIACANIATLLLARAAARRREIGVRLTLGASRFRLVRQLLTESLLLSVIGGAAGFLLAHWGSRVLLLLMSGGAQTAGLEARPDLAVLGFCAGVSVLTGILFGLAPATRATRIDVASSLKETASGLTGVGGRLRSGKALVVLQVGLSLLLLVAAGLFVRTLVNLEKQDLGFNPKNLLVFTLDPTKSGYEGQRALDLYENVRTRLRYLPGVQAVTLSGSGLLTGLGGDWSISPEGYQPKPGQARRIEGQSVGPDFCRTMDVKLMLGRSIDDRDTASSPKVAVVDESLAHYFFGDSNPVGKRFSAGNTFDPKKSMEIVGVVRNFKYRNLRSADSRTVYLPYTQAEWGVGAMHFEVRSAGDPLALISAARDAIREIDPNLALADVKTQTQMMEEALTQERLLAKLCSFFGVLALALAAIGLYGLMAYSVARRTHEIGIRMALGAHRRQILYMVLQQSVVLVAAGTVLGLLAAIATTRLIRSELYGLRPTDPLTLALAAMFMLAVGAFAACLPALRATKVDPMVALRYE
ncbi:MAG: ADOP family duplicated permease [Terriglobia bacterium]